MTAEQRNRPLGWCDGVDCADRQLPQRHVPLRRQQFFPLKLDSYTALHDLQAAHAGRDADELREIAKLLDALANHDETVTGATVVPVAMPPPVDRVIIALNAINAPPLLLAID